MEPLWAGFSNHQRRTVIRAANWTDEKSPYDNLELEGDADDEEVKLAYGRLVKSYLLDAYNNGTWSLEEGEIAEARFIKIQAAYELLIDGEQRRKYDMENQVNPMKIDHDEERSKENHSTWKWERKREMLWKKKEDEKMKLLINRLLAPKGMGVNGPVLRKNRVKPLVTTFYHCKPKLNH